MRRQCCCSRALGTLTGSGGGFGRPAVGAAQGTRQLMEVLGRGSALMAEASPKHKIKVPLWTQNSAPGNQCLVHKKGNALQDCQA